MKKIIGFIILILFLTGSAVSGWASEQDYLHGQIVEVDDYGRTILLRIASEDETDQMVTIFLSQSMTVLPECLQSGRHVRIWGAVSGQDHHFIAEEMRGCGKDSCNDPTGVRSRLSRHGGKHNSGEMCR